MLMGHGQAFIQIYIYKALSLLIAQYFYAEVN